jgi:hypothetical protein
MNLKLYNLRLRLEAILKKLGLLPGARLFVHLILVLIKPEFRRQELERHRHERIDHQRFLQFKREYGDVLRHRLYSASHKQKTILIANGSQGWLEVGLGFIKALEIAGFESVVPLNQEIRTFREHYRLAGIKSPHTWSEFYDPPDLAAAEAVIGRCGSIEDLLIYEYRDARVGRFAISTALRKYRASSLDLRSAQDRRILIKHVASGMASATAAQRILQKVRPEKALIMDPVYTPQGEIFDNCLANGIDVMTMDLARRINTMMLKRYTINNRNTHPASLSSESWRLIRAMDWTDAHREHLQRELYNIYANGDWYNVKCGKSSRQDFISADDIRERLSLDRAKKTAFIFPHILWDASFSWGTTLFDSYEEWFLETVRAACENDQVNWVIRIHPHHVGKSLAEGFQGEPAEVVTLRKHFAGFPPHVFVVPADSDICTYSLFELMDYCLTVRGTIGIEAASLGIPVLTAGTGRYDHKGFTIDSETREEYLTRIAHLQEIQPLLPAQREQAERFAYGIYILRPLPLTSFNVELGKEDDPENNFTKTRFNIRTKEDWYRAPDLGAFTKWVTASREEDFLRVSFRETGLTQVEPL